MKNFFFLLLIVSAFASCTNEKHKDPQTTIFMEEQLKDFIQLNPDWTKNETTEAQITEKFKHKLINLSNEPGFLKNMPLQLTKVIDTAINEQNLKLAKFKTFNDKSRKPESLLNFMQIEILGLISDAQLQKMTVGKNYTLSGTLYKQGKRADVKFIHVSDFRGYDLGKYTFAITDFKAL